MEKFNIQEYVQKSRLKELDKKSNRVLREELENKFRELVNLSTKYYKSVETLKESRDPEIKLRVAELLKKTYNAISTGNENNSLYSNEIFK